MGDGTHIEWTDATWNPITGCSVVSPGCTNCYAMKLAGTRLKNHPSRAGLTADSKAGPVWTGEVRFNEGWLTQPLAWAKPRRVFVCAHGDLFHEDVPDAWIDRVFAVMALAPQHSFQVLTKRAARMRAYLTDGDLADRCDRWFDAACKIWPETRGGFRMRTEGGVLANVWLGVSAENQHWLDVRGPQLLRTPAARRFFSLEPLLGPIDAEPYLRPVRDWSNFWLNNYPLAYPSAPVDWVIVGGESGPRAMHPDWARALRDQCAEAGVAFFFKQWGSCCPLRAELIPVPAKNIGWVHFDGRSLFDPTDAQYRQMERDDAKAGDGPSWSQTVRVGKKVAGRRLDGVTHDAMPVAHG